MAFTLLAQNAKPIDKHFFLQEPFLEGYTALQLSFEDAKLYDCIFQSDDKEVEIRYSFLFDDDGDGDAAFKYGRTILGLSGNKITELEPADIKYEYGGTSGCSIAYETTKFDNTAYKYTVSFSLDKKK